MNAPILPQRRKRVTLRELARELNISERAVSQALNPRKSNVQLSAKTTELVRKLADERNYQPDSRGRSMKYGRFFNLGYFEAKNTPSSWTLPGAEVGVFDAAIERNYRVVLVRLPKNFDDDSADVPAVFKEAMLDALILCHAGNLPKKYERIIDRSGLPVVYLNEKKRHNAIYLDDVRGAEEITAHLVALGHRRIAYLSVIGPEPHYSIGDRKQGYLNALKNAGLKPVLAEFTRSDEWEEQFRLWFERRHREIDAIVCNNDYWAVQILRILYKYHPSIPQKISITGYDDIAHDIAPLKLTTMQVPFYEMGRAAVDMALTLIEQNLPRVPARIFSSRLVTRDSTVSRLNL